ncbi:hypothetical protein FHS27_003903 [Rhodopirellula rubra]|uniref:Uncharacterized protein n=1 Tax=Aporhodopirellula rubra TaxID=980271 RepID=A0A7W5E0U1_9BACT|nr:hypothetical protein [Aporhodopirellula rubra]
MLPAPFIKHTNSGCSISKGEPLGARHPSALPAINSDEADSCQTGRMPSCCGQRYVSRRRATSQCQNRCPIFPTPILRVVGPAFSGPFLAGISTGHTSSPPLILYSPDSPTNAWAYN